MFTRRVHDSGLVPSMGSTGDCYDKSRPTLSRREPWVSSRTHLSLSLPARSPRPLVALFHQPGHHWRILV
jgi:hypothetical protein